MGKLPSEVDPKARDISFLDAYALDGCLGTSVVLHVAVSRHHVIAISRSSRMSGIFMGTQFQHIGTGLQYRYNEREVTHILATSQGIWIGLSAQEKSWKILSNEIGIGYSVWS